MSTDQVYETIGKLCGRSSKEQVRGYASKKEAYRRADTLRKRHPGFHVYIQLFDFEPGSFTGLFQFAVCVEHEKEYSFNMPNKQHNKCV